MNVPHSHGSDLRICYCSNFTPTREQFIDAMRLRQMLGRSVRAQTPWGLGEGESTSMGALANWKRVQRTMPRRGWAQLLVLGECGDALVFLAVPR